MNPIAQSTRLDPLYKPWLRLLRADWTFPLHCPSVTQTHRVSVFLFTIPKIPVLIFVCWLSLHTFISPRWIPSSDPWLLFSPPQFHTLYKLPGLFLHNCFLKFLGLFKDCFLFSSCQSFHHPVSKQLCSPVS